jgi:hypothetical protein
MAKQATATAERVEQKIEEAPATQLPAVRDNVTPLPRAVAAPTYPPKIAKAIIAVTQKIGHVAKDGTNTFQNYKYPKWEDVNEKLSPLLAEHGLIIVQSEVRRDLLESSMEHGSVLAIVYRFTIVNDDGDAWPEIEWTALARLRSEKGVSDDKAAAKCHTQGEKYFSLKMFKVRIGDEKLDSDADDGTGKVSATAEPEAAEEPHLVTVSKGGAKAWAQKYMGAIRRARSADELMDWMVQNTDQLKKLETADDALSKKVSEATKLRFGELPPVDEAAKPAAPEGKPLPPRVDQKAAQQKPVEPPKDDIAQALDNAAAKQQDPMAIPDNLKRMGNVEIQQWLDKLHDDLEAAPTQQTALDVQMQNLTTDMQRKVTPAAWAEAVKKVRARAQYLLDHPTKQAFDAEKWLAPNGDLETALAACEALEQLDEVKDKTLIPSKDSLTTDQWKRAVKLYRSHLGRIDPEAI